MATLEDVLAVEEGGEEGEEEQYYRSAQALINKGVWGLQGFFGRAMMDGIEAGFCALGPNPAYDYYGNRIPSRFEVEAGTKGSVEFVLDRSPFGKVLE